MEARGITTMMTITNHACGITAMMTITTHVQFITNNDSDYTMTNHSVDDRETAMQKLKCLSLKGCSSR